MRSFEVGEEVFGWISVGFSSFSSVLGFFGKRLITLAFKVGSEFDRVVLFPFASSFDLINLVMRFFRVN